MPSLAFLNPYAHGFVRVAVAVPRVRVADPAFNAAETIALARAGRRRRAPSWSPSRSWACRPTPATTCSTSARCSTAARRRCATRRRGVRAKRRRVAIVGLPLRVDHRLFNCAAVVAGGRLLGVVPKTYLPNYGEFYEARQFNSGDTALAREIDAAAASDVPFGTDLLFQARQPAAADAPRRDLRGRVGADPAVDATRRWPARRCCVNLSASNITIGKADYRHQLVQPAVGALPRGLPVLVGRRRRVDHRPRLGRPGADLRERRPAGRVGALRRRLAPDHRRRRPRARLARAHAPEHASAHSVAQHKARLAGFRTRRLRAAAADARCRCALQRRVERFPYVPADPARRDERCTEVYNIQVQALVQRLRRAGIDKLVIGVSGGLDSTHALLVCAQAMDRARPAAQQHPRPTRCPASRPATRTLDQARRLMAAVGCSAARDRHPAELRADAARPRPSVSRAASRSTTSPSRTCRPASAPATCSGSPTSTARIVVGTGDLSELALGWCTYGVGDHMSHYNVNASVPKTLIQHLVRWVAETRLGRGRRATTCCDDILDTEISPELVPGRASADAARRRAPKPAIGPYELQDFHLYHMLRFGFAPTQGGLPGLHRLARPRRRRLARRPRGRAQPVHAGRDQAAPAAPSCTASSRPASSSARCVPNAPKVGSGGSLSPRGDWRAPSDSEATVWLADLARVPDAP